MYICSRLSGYDIPLIFHVRSLIIKVMKKVKTTNIEADKLITKAKYAEKMGVSQTAVQNWINEGKLTIVKANGAELIHE